ncbi:transcriptional regulator family: Fungal Specific TF [Purpureocillium lilacinum]|uniref:Transcriptional regulator family: Fungal Specific TF n=1 Tax=Purpureocillium lilacinum TaxID=33203 RepID=A0ABR0BJM1_PURLI|nr:transcriptional regulator family: Fungal Specific TF [Purpureocillium lilacinum]
MFGTWKYDPETDQMRNLRRAYDPITARSWQHQACNRCHEKKLKCSGRRDRCDRCAVSGSVCAYDRPGGSLKGSSGSGRRGAHARAASSSSAGKARARNGSGTDARCGTSPALQSAAVVTAALAQQRSGNQTASRIACRKTDFATANDPQMDTAFDLGQRQQVTAAAALGGACCCGPCYHGCAWIADFSSRSAIDSSMNMATSMSVSGVGAASYAGTHPQLYDDGCGVAIGGHSMNVDESFFWRQSR